MGIMRAGVGRRVMMCVYRAIGVMVAGHLRTVVMGRGGRMLRMMVARCAKHSGRAQRRLEWHSEEQHD